MKRSIPTTLCLFAFALFSSSAFAQQQSPQPTTAVASSPAAPAAGAADAVARQQASARLAAVQRRIPNARRRIRRRRIQAGHPRCVCAQPRATQYAREPDLLDALPVSGAGCAGLLARTPSPMRRHSKTRWTSARPTSSSERRKLRQFSCASDVRNWFSANSD